MLRNKYQGIKNLFVRQDARYLNNSSVHSNLFGGQKQLKFEPPSGKGESSANPADLIKRNDILMHSSKPINYIESVKTNGFHLANGIYIKSPDKNDNIIGAFLINNEAIEINLSKGGYSIVNSFMIDFNEQILQILNKIHPKPEILVVGLGRKSRMLALNNRRYISTLGIQTEVSDSKNAAQIYDLLATERPGVIAALILPPNV